MSSTQSKNEHVAGIAPIATADLKVEIVVIPVSDVDRAKRFYESLGWRLDADFASREDDWRLVQMTPPGSPCSIMFGRERSSWSMISRPHAQSSSDTASR
jgi:hypothetical protein